MRPEQLVQALITPGTRVHLRTHTHVVADDYVATVLEAGTTAVEITCPTLPHETFVAHSSGDARTHGEALLGLSQGNPVPAVEDLDYGGVDERKRRIYRFERTTAPFLLSADLTDQVRSGGEIEVGLFAERWNESYLEPVGRETAPLVVDGEVIDVEVVRYREPTPDLHTSFVVVAGTGVVLDAHLEDQKWRTQVAAVERA